MKRTLALLLLLSSFTIFSFGQASLGTGNPVVTNGLGQPMPGVTVAVCTTNPGFPSTGNCSGSTLAATYTDVTGGHACTGTAQPLNNSSAPTLGSGCSNPGLVDGLGNVIVYAGAGQYWCEEYGGGVVGISVAPCIFPATTSGIQGTNNTFTGSNTFTGGLTEAQTGIYTNTQMNLYLQALLNGLSPQTEFQAANPTANTTSAIVGGTAVPVGATVTSAEGVSAFVNNSSTGVNALATYSEARCLVNSSKCWGGNFVTIDAPGLTTGVNFNGLESDLQPQNPLATYAGTTGISSYLITSQTGTFPGSAFQATADPALGPAKWSGGFTTVDSCCAAAFSVGATGTTSSSSSQPTQINFFDSGDVKRTATSDITGAGLWRFTEPSAAAGGWSFINGSTTEAAIDSAGNTSTTSVSASASAQGLASKASYGYDANTGTPNFSSNNNTITSFSGAWSCTNTTPVTVSTSTTGDQNLMACTIPGALLNKVGRTLRVYIAGIYSTAASSTSQMTLKVKLCTVSGCGSGTVITPISIQSTALGTLTIANNNFRLHSDITSTVGGASAAYEAHGEFLIDLGATTTTADSVFGDTNTATVGTIDSTAQLFLQISIAFSAASASNTATNRLLVVDTVN